MRITGGTLRGRTLLTPENQLIRPTADKTRLAVFNMLQSRHVIVDAVVMDAFCGTGALGLEAVSRGAARAILMDNAPSSLTLARKNTEALRLSAQVTLIGGDATKLPARAANQPAATLVFIDPPYRQGLINPTLSALSGGAWLSAGATVVVEVEGDYTPAWPAGFTQVHQKTYGQSAIYLLEYAA